VRVHPVRSKSSKFGFGTCTSFKPVAIPVSSQNIRRCRGENLCSRFYIHFKRVSFEGFLRALASQRQDLKRVLTSIVQTSCFNKHLSETFWPDGGPRAITKPIQCSYWKHVVASRLDRRNLSNVKAPISPLAVDKKSDNELSVSPIKLDISNTSSLRSTSHFPPFRVLSFQSPRRSWDSKIPHWGNVQFHSALENDCRVRRVPQPLAHYCGVKTSERR
jgi:hypothetical protein